MLLLDLQMKDVKLPEGKFDTIEITCSRHL